MAFVTILDFRIGEVIIQEYDDCVEDVETEVIHKLVSHDDIQFMCTDTLKLSINKNEIE